MATALVLVGLAGCARFETFPLPSLPAHNRTSSQEKEGLTISAQLLSSPLTTRYHFGPDLRKEGLLPVFLSIENRGGGNFEIERSKLRLVLEKGERLEPVAPQEIFAKIRRSTLPAYVFAPLVLPAIWLHRHIEDSNYYAAQTLFEKSLPPTIRIEKDDPPLTRAVFFRDPEGRLRAERTLSSSVINILVEVEGAKAAPQEEPVKPPETRDSEGTPSAAPPARTVGRTVSFTVSLTTEDI